MVIASIKEPVLIILYNFIENKVTLLLSRSIDLISSLGGRINIYNGYCCQTS